MGALFRQHSSFFLAPDEEKAEAESFLTTVSLYSSPGSREDNSFVYAIFTAMELKPFFPTDQFIPAPFCTVGGVREKQGRGKTGRFEDPESFQFCVFCVFAPDDAFDLAEP